MAFTDMTGDGSLDQEKTQLLEILHSVCDRLEQLGEDAVILTSLAESMFGTSVGERFFSSNLPIDTDFKHWCQGQRFPIKTLEKNELPIGNISISEPEAPFKVEIVDQIDADADQDNSNVEELPVILDTVGTHVDKGTGTDDITEDPSDVETPEDITDHDYDPDNDNTDKLKSDQLDVKDEKETKEEHPVTNVIKDFKESISMRDLVTSSVTKVVEVNDKKMELVYPEDAEIENMEDETGDRNCFKCGKILTSLGRLKEHLTKMHSIKLGYKCVCGRFYPDNQSFEKHINCKNFKTKHLFCEKCEVLFENNDEFVTHDKEYHEENMDEVEQIGEFPCEKCEIVFKHKNHLVIHGKRFTDCVEQLKSREDINLPELNKKTVTYEEDSKKVTKTFKELLENVCDGSFICCVCKSLFTRKSNFIRHLRGHVGQTDTICEICGISFKGREGLTRHVREHFNRPYNCDHCRQRFKTEKKLQFHVRKICRGGDRENFRCDICKHVAANMSALEKHKNVHTGIRAFACEHCGKKVSTIHSLERHMVTMHSKDTPYACDMCTKAFKTRDNLRKHKKTHDIPKYRCDVCGKGCTELGNLKKHMMSHTKEKPFVCEVCGKAYGRNALLENHRRVHTGEKPYKCVIEGCGKSFRSYANLNQHIRTHSTTSPFICDICGKTFKQPGRLNHHRKFHTSDFRWTCLYCPSQFRSMFMYKNHLAKNHPEMIKEIEEKTNIKLYQCHLCQKTYGDKEDLTRHVYIHNGTKPFDCSVCGKSFNDKSNMKQHEKTHLSKRALSCNVCNRTFMYAKTLRLHKKNCPEVLTVPSSPMTNHPGVPVPVSDMGEETFKDNMVIICDNGSYQTIPHKYIVNQFPSTSNNQAPMGATVQILPSGHLDPSAFTDAPPNSVVGFVQPLMVVNNL